MYHVSDRLFNQSIHHSINQILTTYPPMHIIESPVVMREEEERKLCRHGLGLLWAGDGLYPVLAVGVVLLVVLLLARHLGAKLILLEIRRTEDWFCSLI